VVVIVVARRPLARSAELGLLERETLLVRFFPLAAAGNLDQLDKVLTFDFRQLPLGMPGLDGLGHPFEPLDLLGRARRPKRRHQMQIFKFDGRRAATLTDRYKRAQQQAR
jgi:hypothetical protein